MWGNTNNTVPQNPQQPSMFPSFQPQNPNPNPGFQPQPQPQNQPLLPNMSSNDQYCLNNLAKILEQVYSGITNPDLFRIIPYLANEQNQIIKNVQQVTKIQVVNEFEQQYLKQVKQRCLKLKNNNQILLIKMFDIKDKMSRVLAPSIDRNANNQEQFNIIHDKIRRVRMDISNKLNHIKNRRLFDQAFNKNRQAVKKNYAPISLALTQFRDVTETIDKQLIRQRQQIRELIKLLYDQNI